MESTDVMIERMALRLKMSPLYVRAHVQAMRDFAQASGSPLVNTAAEVERAAQWSQSHRPQCQWFAAARACQLIRAAGGKYCIADDGSLFPGAAERDPVFPVFPVVAGKGQPRRWTLPDSLVLDLAQTYPQVDVQAQCRKAWLWLAVNPSRRKTQRGLPRFLAAWMQRCQDGSARAAAASPSARVAKMTQRIGPHGAGI